MDFFSKDPQNWDETKNEVNLDLIREAKARIRDIVPETPVTKSVFQSQSMGRDIWYKLENFNVTGSFKIRGAANALLSASPNQITNGVIAASAGNHAQGVAYVSQLLGLRSTIFMPARTPLNKVSATRSYGAEVILDGALYDDAFQNAINFQKSSGGLLIHAFSDAAVMNGQGTIGLEILDQVPNLGAIMIPIGGGGLCGGIAVAIKTLRPDIKIIGVQTEAFPSMKEAIHTKQALAVQAGQTIADGIAVKRPSPRTLSVGLKYIDDVIIVSEIEIAAAVMNLMEKDHMLAEGGGAVGVAALSKIPSHILKALDKKTICCVISGGNIDVTLLTRIANKGLIASGRMMKIAIRTKDQPGKLAEILTTLSATGANLIEVRHHRNFGAMYYSDVDIELELETTHFGHQEQIRDHLIKAGHQIL